MSFLLKINPRYCYKFLGRRMGPSKAERLKKEELKAP